MNQNGYCISTIIFKWHDCTLVRQSAGKLEQRQFWPSANISIDHKAVSDWYLGLREKMSQGYKCLWEEGVQGCMKKLWC